MRCATQNRAAAGQNIKAVPAAQAAEIPTSRKVREKWGTRFVSCGH
jgi:hypothetical protein